MSEFLPQGARIKKKGNQGTGSRHGTNARYQRGCKCELCRAAHTEAQRKFRAQFEKEE